MVGFSRTEENGSKILDDSFSFSLPDIYGSFVSLPYTDSFVDFDPIKEWLEEDPPIGPPPYSMDDVGVQERTQYGSVEKFDQMGSHEFCVKTSGAEKCSEDCCEEAVVVTDVGVHGSIEKFDQMGSNEICVKTSGAEESSEMKRENCCEEVVVVADVLEKGDVEAVEKSVEKGSEEVVEKLESNVEFSIEEELRRVSLNREVNDFDMAGKINNGVLGEGANVSITDSIHNVDSNGGGKNEARSHKDESRSESESGSDSESESDSGSSTSETSSDEDDDDKDEKLNRKTNVAGRETELEEGEIMAFEEEEMVAWSDEDDDDDSAGTATKGPIRSKNEIADLPPVPPVNVSLLPHHQTLPVGIISSILGHQVIVEGVERHNPLSEGSIIWITESRSPLGIVDEIFGPVKNPYYIVRYNSDSEVPAGIQPGTKISFVPEFADHVLNNANLYRKGYDASGENDEELPEEAEFSDDEKEAEYRRMQKMKKRGTNNDKDENKKKDKRNSRNRFGVAKLELSAAKQTHDLANNVSTQHSVQPPGVSSGSRPIFSNGLMPSHPLSQLGMAPASSAASSNNVWSNGNVSQSTAGTGFPINPQMTGMPWLQGNHPQPVVQAPFLNVAPYQQNIHTNPSLPSNFGPGPTFAAWPDNISPNFFNQTLFGMGMQGQNASTPTNIGPNVSSSGFQHGGVAPTFFNQSILGMGMQGHNASTPDGFQQLANSNPGQDTFQSFNTGNNRGMGMQGQNAPTPTNIGANVSSNGFQHGSMAPTFFNQSILGMGMQGHNASTPNGFQQFTNSNPGQDTFQNFNPGNNRGNGRRPYHRGGGRFGGGRGRRPS